MRAIYSLSNVPFDAVLFDAVLVSFTLVTLGVSLLLGMAILIKASAFSLSTPMHPRSTHV